MPALFEQIEHSCAMTQYGTDRVVVKGNATSNRCCRTLDNVCQQFGGSGYHNMAADLHPKVNGAIYMPKSMQDFNAEAVQGGDLQDTRIIGTQRLAIERRPPGSVAHRRRQTDR